MLKLLIDLGRPFFIDDRAQFFKYTMNSDLYCYSLHRIALAFACNTHLCYFLKISCRVNVKNRKVFMMPVCIDDFGENPRVT